MDKEIEKILNRLNYFKESPNKLSYYPEDLLSREDMLLLLDYITKLQRYVDDTFLYTYEELQDKVIALQFKVIEKQEKINKAIEYIQKFEDIKAYYSYEENGYEEYNYDEEFKEELLNILQGSEDQ